jgi:hypothetical protein
MNALIIVIILFFIFFGGKILKKIKGVTGTPTVGKVAIGAAVAAMFTGKKLRTVFIYLVVYIASLILLPIMFGKVWDPIWDAWRSDTLFFWVSNACIIGCILLGAFFPKDGYGAFAFVVVLIAIMSHIYHIRKAQGKRKTVTENYYLFPKSGQLPLNESDTLPIYAYLTHKSVTKCYPLNQPGGAVFVFAADTTLKFYATVPLEYATMPHDSDEYKEWQDNQKAWQEMPEGPYYVYLCDRPQMTFYWSTP